MIKIGFLIFSFFSHLTWAGGSKPAVSRDCYMDPCELQGDFDGDGKLDTAFLVQNKSKKKGIQIQFANKKTVVLGAGKNLGNGGDDFSWMDSWKVHEGPIEPGVGEGKPPIPKGATLLIEKKESASAVIYWNGSKFIWYQQGD